MTSCPAPEHVIASDRGELTPERQEDLEAHLEGCLVCRDDLRLLGALRRGIERHGVATRLGDGRSCADEMQIARFAEGRLSPGERDALAHHLLRCGHCLTLLDAAMLEVSEREARPVTAPLSRAHPSVGGWIRTHLAPRRVLNVTAPALAAAVVLVAVISPHLTPPRDLAALATIDALPVRHVRGGTDPQGFDAIYHRALLDYDAGDYAAAVPSLTRARSLGPDRSEPALYLGSALLLQGDAAAASQVLEPLSRLSPEADNPRVIEEARWLLGQACLLLNDRGCAVEAFEGVVALAGRREAAARAILREL